MSVSEQRMSRISRFMWRPLPDHQSSPLKIRENNFMLDCTNRQYSTMPAYKAQNDAFIKPYLSTLLQKANSQNSSSQGNLRIKKSCKIRSHLCEPVEAQQFRKFLANQMEVTMRRIEGSQTGSASSCCNSPQKENQSQHLKKAKQIEKFIEAKFNSYKIRSKRGFTSRKPKNSESLHQK